MSNSIIDQQRDNETFFWVQYSWLPGPVKRYDHEADMKRMQELGDNLVYDKTGSNSLIQRMQNLREYNKSITNVNPFFWIDPTIANS